MVSYLTGLVAIGFGLAMVWFMNRRLSRTRNHVQNDLFHWSDHLVRSLLDSGGNFRTLDRLFTEAALQLSGADEALLLEPFDTSFMNPALSAGLTARARISIAIQNHRGVTNDVEQRNQMVIEWEWPEQSENTHSSHQEPATWIADYRTLSSTAASANSSRSTGLWLIPFVSLTSQPRWLALIGDQRRIKRSLPIVRKLVREYFRGDSEFRTNAALLNIGSLVFDNSGIPLALIVKDQILQHNRSFEELTGLSRIALHGKPYQSVFVPEDISEVQEHLARMLGGKHSTDDFEARIFRQNGFQAHVSLHPTLVTYLGERAFVIAIRDITPQVNLEQSLLSRVAQQELVVEELMEANNNLQLHLDDYQTRMESQQERLVLSENILSGITDWIRVIDRDHTVTYLNPSMREAMGDLVGTKCYQSLGYPAGCPGCPLENVVESNSTQRADLTIGLQTYSVICSPILSPEGSVQAVIELIQNNTEFKNLQESMREKSEILEAVNESVVALNCNLEAATLQLAEKNDELEKLNQELKTLDQLKDNFVSTVSHELRAPLTSIKGSVGLILNGMVGEVDPKIAKYLTVCQRNADRLIHLINDLLDLSKIESGRIQIEPGKHLLKELAMEATENLSNYAVDKSVNVRVEVADDLEIWVDRDRCLQVFQNLLSNALKFTKSGEVVVRGGKVADGVRIEVQDTGIGIPKDQVKKIFGRFTQVDSTLTRKVGGTGLGLAICKAIALEHRGNIDVESELGKGSCFRVFFPDITDQPVSAQSSKTTQNSDDMSEDLGEKTSEGDEKRTADAAREKACKNTKSKSSRARQWQS